MIASHILPDADLAARVAAVAAELEELVADGVAALGAKWQLLAGFRPFTPSPNRKFAEGTCKLY